MGCTGYIPFSDYCGDPWEHIDRINELLVEYRIGIKLLKGFQNRNVALSGITLPPRDRKEVELRSQLASVGIYPPEPPASRSDGIEVLELGEMSSVWDWQTWAEECVSRFGKSIGSAGYWTNGKRLFVYAWPKLFILGREVSFEIINRKLLPPGFPGLGESDNQHKFLGE